MNAKGLLDLRGYLRLVDSLLFCHWEDFPQPEEARARFGLVARALVLVTASSLLMWFAASFLGLVSLSGVVLGIIVGIAFAAIVTVVGVATFGQWAGVTGGVAFGVIFAVALSITSATQAFWGVWLVMGAAASFGAGTARGMVRGLSGYVAFGTSFIVMSAMTLGAANSGWQALPAAALAFALTGFLTFWVSLYFSNVLFTQIDNRLVLHSTRADWLLGTAVVVILGLGMSVLTTVMSLPRSLIVIQPLALAGIYALAYFRAPLWVVEWGWALLARPTIRSASDPAQLVRAIRRAYFDKAMIMPLPGEGSALSRLDSFDHDWAIRETIATALHSNHTVVALTTLRHFASCDPLRVQAHIRGVQEAEGAQERMIGFVSMNLPLAPALAWRAMTRLSKQNAESTVAQSIGEVSLDLSTVEQAIDELDSALRLDPSLPNVGAMSALYKTILSIIDYQQATDIADYQEPILPKNAPLLFPAQLIAILSDLADLTPIMRSYRQASSPITRRNDFLMANASLEVSAKRIADVPAPAGPLLALGIRRWHQLLTSTGGQVAGERARVPISNPYEVGNPVSGELFMGRDDIMSQLEELWSKRGQRTSVILYGHRRMGKSSILRNLGMRFGERTVIVDFNIQRVGWVTSTGELLHSLALALYDSLSDDVRATIGEPIEERFLQHNPYDAFDRYLRRLHHVREQDQFVVTMDEFESIEAQISRGRLDPELLQFLRGLIQSYPWFVVVFAGLHTLQEMTADYWNPLFSSVTTIPVGFLSRHAARRLITCPASDFPVAYDPEAVDLHPRPDKWATLPDPTCRTYTDHSPQQGDLRGKL